jgi:hypothetical protein
MALNLKEAQRTPVSEGDLRDNFERYRELVDELARKYPLPAETVPLSSGGQSGDYVFEPVFFYQVHARS